MKKINLLIIGVILACNLITAQQTVNYNGWSYTTVVIGEQEWFTENLRSEKLNDGTDIPFINHETLWTTDTDAGMAQSPAWKLSNEEYLYDRPDEWGLLYNITVVLTEKICPTGWKVPSDSEWYELEALVDPTTLTETDDYRGEVIFSKLASTDGWYYGEDLFNGTDDYGFKALPNGRRATDKVKNMGYGDNDPRAYIWGADSCLRELKWSDTGIRRKTPTVGEGYAIRCMKDLTPPSSDATLSDLAVNSATITNFAAGTNSYTVALPKGTTNLPVVTYTTSDTKSTVVVTDATDLAGTEAERTTTVVVTAEDGTMVTYTIVFTVSTGIYSEQYEKLSIYPVPAGDEITISGTSNVSKLEIMDVTGKVLRQVEITGDDISINISEFSQGMYFLRTESQTLKFIKK